MQVDGADMYGKGMAQVVPILLGLAIPLLHFLELCLLDTTLSFCRF